MAGKIDWTKNDGYRKVEKSLILFLRKYYGVMILRGFLALVIITGTLFLLILLLNGWISPSPDFRKIIFYGFVLTFLFLILLNVFIPIFRFVGMIRTRKVRKAENILRKNFPDLKDQLLNLIELGDLPSNHASVDLITASIEDKIRRIKPFNFKLAIPYKYLLLPSAGFLTLVLFAYGISQIKPDVLRRGYERTVNYNIAYDETKPLEFVILNDSMKVIMGKDFRLRVRTLHQQPANPLFVEMGETRHDMDPKDNYYEYIFKSVNGELGFKISDGEVYSDQFNIELLSLPLLKELKVRVIPPKHTDFEIQHSSGIGDLVIAEGSVVKWDISALYTDRIGLLFSNDSLWLEEDEGSFTKGITHSQRYGISLMSKKISESQIDWYSIDIIRDEYPSIVANRQVDSLNYQYAFCEADVTDDYGFSQMDFIVRHPISLDTLFLDTIPVRKEQIYQRVYYTADFKSMGLKPQTVEYYFTIWDNDGVNGPKSSSSRVFQTTLMNSEELFQQNRKTGEKIEQEVEKSKNLLDDLKRKVAEMMNSQMIDDKEDWQLKDQVEEMSEMRNAMEEMINNIKNENRKLNTADQKQSEKMRAVLEKQMQIEELFDKLMDDELKKLFEEFEKLADEMNKKERIEKTNELKNNIENLERQLDINLELLKKLEISKEILNLSEQLKDLSDKLKEGSKLNAQEARERFNELEKKYEEQLEKNRALRKPDELKEYSKEREEINQLLDKKENEGEKSPGQKEKDAAEKMNKLSEEMEMQIGGGGGSGSNVDLEMVRQLMRELNDYSIKQESLLTGLSNYNSRSPKFIETGSEQIVMANKFSIIRDSLVALGYQEPMIAALINEQVFHVETSIKNLDQSVQEGNVSKVRYEQQKVMEGTNELAVRLDELLDNVQAMKGQGEGKQKFTDSNPKENGEKISEMKDMQESMKEQMKKMIQQMKAGQKSGTENKEMVKMLSEREQLRRAMDELKNSGNLGKEANDKLNDAQQMMEEVEKDIIYNRLSEQTTQKEAWIETRLLEAENAEKERDQEETRVSKEFEGRLEGEELPGWEETQKKLMENNRKMGYPDIKLKSYYQEKYRNYLKKLAEKRNGN